MSEVHDIQVENGRVIEEFRANAGKVGGKYDGTSLVILHTTGAKSGAERLTPLACVREGDHLCVFAANPMRLGNPAWYANLRADPRVHVEVGADTWAARAVELHGTERDQVFAAFVQDIPDIPGWQDAAGRIFPIIRLERTTAPAASEDADSNAGIIEEFRAKGGKLGGQFTGGRFLILHTIGRKSGTERLTPMAYIPHGDRLLVVAAGPGEHGTRTAPDWYRNLMARPAVTIEIGAETRPVTAVAIDPDQREDAWAAVIAAIPHFRSFRANPHREVPIIALSPT